MKLHSLGLKSLTLALGVAALSACAPMVSGTMNMGISQADVQNKTAQYFGVPSREIMVTNIDKGVLSTSYQARYAGKFFNCQIYYGEVSCRKPGA